MPRTFTTSFRNEIEAPASSEVLLCFATLTHGSLSEPARAVCDVVDYLYGGLRYYGVPFEFVLLGDGERPPRARLRMHNVDGRLGTIAQALTTSPRIRFDIMAASDWGDPALLLDSATGDMRKTRSPLGTPDVEYSADHLRLSNVTGDAIQIEADIETFDLTREPWPSVRATRNRLPGLFR